MSCKPDLTVAAIVEHEGRFLVVKERIARRVVFNQPAGHVEPNEAIVDAAIRETLEETAWTFEPDALVGIYLWTDPSSARSFLRAAFCGTVRDHQPHRPLDKGILQATWLTHAELCERSDQLRSPTVLRCIDDYLDGARYPLTLLKHVVTELHTSSAPFSSVITVA